MTFFRALFVNLINFRGLFPPGVHCADGDRTGAPLHAYVGKHLSSRGGRDFENFKGGEYFLEKFWRGIDFLPSKGGISFRLLYQNFKNFPKFPI